MNIQEIEMRADAILGSPLDFVLNNYFDECLWPELYKFHTEQAGMPKSGPLVDEQKAMSWFVFLEAFVEASGRSELQ